MAAEVSLAPNLLSLYRCQSLYCLHIAKTPTPGTEIRRIRSTSGQHSSWHLYLPNRPDVLLVKRVSQATTSLSAQPPRISARVTGITGLDKPICPTARAHFAPNGYSQTEYHRPLLPKKQTPNKTVSRQFCPASVYACSLFRNFHTVFEFAAFGNSFRQFVKVAVLKLYFFKSNMLQIQFFEYTPVEYHICQFYFRKLQM